MRLALILLALATAAQAQEPQPRSCLDAAASNYVGETERNQGRAFHLARQSDLVLLFDEADALFGRRTQTRDAHDRYANQEVSYLIARIEEFESVQLLTSNNRRMLVAGFRGRQLERGLVVIETETGARVIELARGDRRHALEYAEATLRECPPE